MLCSFPSEPLDKNLCFDAASSWNTMILSINMTTCTEEVVWFAMMSHGLDIIMPTLVTSSVGRKRCHGWMLDGEVGVAKGCQHASPSLPMMSPAGDVSSQTRACIEFKGSGINDWQLLMPTMGTSAIGQPKKESPLPTTTF